MTRYPNIAAQRVHCLLDLKERLEEYYQTLLEAVRSAQERRPLPRAEAILAIVVYLGLTPGEADALCTACGVEDHPDEIMQVLENALIALKRNK